MTSTGGSCSFSLRLRHPDGCNILAVKRFFAAQFRIALMGHLIRILPAGRLGEVGGGGVVKEVGIRDVLLNCSARPWCGEGLGFQMAYELRPKKSQDNDFVLHDGRT